MAAKMCIPLACLLYTSGVCAVFIASCYGIDLTIGQMATIVLTATLASIGTAGVPGAGMVMLAMVLQSVNIPVEGIALVAGIDRIFDMGRTTINITGDAACAVVVSKMEDRKAVSYTHLEALASGVMGLEGKMSMMVCISDWPAGGS